MGRGGAEAAGPAKQGRTHEQVGGSLNADSGHRGQGGGWHRMLSRFQVWRKRTLVPLLPEAESAPGELAVLRTH